MEGEEKMFNYKETVDKLIQNEIDRGELSGASFLVLHKGKEMFFDAYGYADKEEKRLMKRDTIIR